MQLFLCCCYNTCLDWQKTSCLLLSDCYKGAFFHPVTLHIAEQLILRIPENLELVWVCIRGPEKGFSKKPNSLENFIFIFL